MNIGEISKPTVDRSQIKKSLKVKLTDPVGSSDAVSDLVELSEESRYKYQKEQSKHHSDDKKPPQVSSDDGSSAQISNSIDIEV